MVAKPGTSERGTGNDPAPSMTRIDLRCPVWVKEMIQQAAEESGRSMSDFVLAAALDDARDLLRDRYVFQFDRVDAERLLEMMDREPREIPELQNAAERHRTWCGE